MKYKSLFQTTLGPSHPRGAVKLLRSSDWHEMGSTEELEELSRLVFITASYNGDNGPVDFWSMNSEDMEWRWRFSMKHSTMPDPESDIQVTEVVKLSVMAWDAQSNTWRRISDTGSVESSSKRSLQKFMQSFGDLKRAHRSGNFDMLKSVLEVGVVPKGSSAPKWHQEELISWRSEFLAPEY